MKIKKYYSELSNGKGYVVRYLCKSYRHDLEHLKCLEKELKNDFPDTKDDQITVKTIWETKWYKGALALIITVTELDLSKFEPLPR